MDFDHQKKPDGTVFSRRMLHFLSSVILSLLLLAQGVGVYAGTVSSSYSTECSITVQTQGSRITVRVPERSDFHYVKLGLLSKNTGLVSSGRMQDASSGGVSLSTASFSNGTYYLQIWKSADGSSQTEIFTDRLGAVITVSEGSPSVRKSSVYDKYANRYSQKGSSVDELYYYLQMSDLIQSEDRQIISRAESITSGITGAYAKAKAIHDWVAENIYYNVDAEQNADQFEIGKDLCVDALGTLNQRTSVCQGYADLTAALLRVSGIPARTVIGYALTGAQEEWDSSNSYGETSANHAWVEAWLQGRWVLMDPTWDSRSIYYKGNGMKSDCVDTYFDSTLDFFAYGHYQQGEDEYLSSGQNEIRMNFEDIQNHWGYDAIRFAVNNEIMHGMGDEWFRPDGTTTQAMFLTMLANCAGEQIENAASGPWYTTYTSWAEENGIIDGMQGYDPEALITREQMAVMLWNFILYSQASVSEQAAADFSDMDETSFWAVDAICHLAASGIVQGRGDGKYAPKAYFTRAEAATIVRRCCEVLLKTYLNT